jgi:electron transfer flavoprotein beta subunit
VERVLDDGTETMETALPAVVTVSNELGAPRAPSLRETMRAARKPVAVWKAGDLGLETGAVGVAGARAVRERLFAPVKNSRCEMIEAATPEAQGAKLAQRLREAKVL